MYGEDFGSLCFDAAANRYTADPSGDCVSEATRSAQAFSFDNPDLNVTSLRGNAVLRWEYRPGSTLFLVWQQQRAGCEPVRRLRVRPRHGRHLPGAPGQHLRHQGQLLDGPVMV